MFSFSVYFFNNNCLYSLHKRHINHNAKKYKCVCTAHKITHLLKKHTKCYIKNVYRLL